MSNPALGGGFTLTDAGTRADAGGLRSADAIDRPGADRLGNAIKITTDVGVSSLPPEQLAVLQSQLSKAGLTPSTYTPTGTLDDETKAALLELKRTAQSTGLSDMETLRTRINTQAMVAAGGVDGTGPSTTTNKTITEAQFTDPMTVRAMFRQTLTDRLGREPTAGEYQRARKLISNSEGGQDVTTTVTRNDGQGNTVSRVKHKDDTTDPSPDVILDDYSRRGKLGREANTFTAATDYLGVIDRLTGG